VGASRTHVAKIARGTHVGTNKTPGRRDTALSQDQGWLRLQVIAATHSYADAMSQEKTSEERTDVHSEETLGTRVLFCCDRRCCLPTLTEGGSDQQSADSVIVSSNAPETVESRSHPQSLRSQSGLSRGLAVLTPIEVRLLCLLECQLPRLDVDGSIPSPAPSFQ